MQFLSNIDWLAFIRVIIDSLAVLLLVYLMLALSSDRRTLLMVRGFIILLILLAISDRFNLRLLEFILDKLLIGAAVAMAVMLQPELRRFLEQLGSGKFGVLLTPVTAKRSNALADSLIDEMMEAVVELSQNRTGALIIVETGEAIDERDFSVPGVAIDAKLSKELLQTIFQTNTLLHDGAVWLREDRVLAAGVILPISERAASREIGTRHRAAMGITDRVGDCFCIVVSEETGSIAIAENGRLDRPVSSSKLREVLEQKFASDRSITLAERVSRFGLLWKWLRLDKLVDKLVKRNLSVKK
jgi:uncharacterized protein (TIGR00159 family)